MNGDVIPWTSISDMLVRNKCWICESVFQRGSKRKVFMVSNLISYLKSCSRVEVNEESDRLRSCYERFELIGLDETRLLDELTSVNLPTWTSGLICGQNSFCLRQYQLLVPNNSTSQMPSNTNAMSSSKVSDLKEDCEPGCNCDNPWPFMT